MIPGRSLMGVCEGRFSGSGFLISVLGGLCLIVDGKRLCRIYDWVLLDGLFFYSNFWKIVQHRRIALRCRPSSSAFEIK